MKPRQFVLLLAAGLFWFAQYIYIPYQTAFLLSLGVSSAVVGIVTGAYGFSQMALRVPVGLAADRQGRHRFFIFWGLAAAALGSLLRILCPDALGFTLASLLSGVASAMWISFMVLFISYFKPEEMAKATGLIIGANNTGILLAFACGMFSYEKMGMSFLCLLSVLFAVGGIFLVLFIYEKPRAADFQPALVRELIKICANRKLLVFAGLAVVQQGLMMATAMSFTIAILKNLGADGFDIGLSSLLFIAAVVAGAYFSSSQAAAKIQPVFWVLSCFGVLAVYCFVTVRMSNIWAVDLLQVAAGVATGFLSSILTAEAMREVPPDKKSTAMGLYQAVYAIGMTALPLLAGSIAEKITLTRAFDFLTALSILALTLAFVYYRNQSRNLKKQA
ncbi:MAG: MFS transporter [Clostridia bacterium]|nr:MFS transporter [Clostridia bacterium]